VKIRPLLLIALLTCLSAWSGAAQSTRTFDLSELPKGKSWRLSGRTVSVVEAKGKTALKFSEGPGMGIAWLDGYTFTNGVIEVDILGRSQPVQGSFLGIAFRVVGAETQDVVYFRPFNFRATDPERHKHAVQYVSHPQWTWQKLRAERTNQYEKAIEPEVDGDEWFHARIVVERPKVTVYVNGAATPSLAVEELSDRSDGSLGLWVGEGSGGHFANLKVTPRK
jgi:hypothetical protein